MNIRATDLAILAILFSLLSGCAAYRTSSNVDAGEQDRIRSPVLVTTGNLSHRPHQEIGPIEVSIKKLTLFHADPTEEQAAEALADRARTMGANGVKKVTYKKGVGFTTWGYIDAKGIAVKILD